METMTMTSPRKEISSKAVWTGRIISGLCTLFLLADALFKIISHEEALKGTTNLGWSASAVVPIGIVLLACTILYAFPRTAIIGAILLTGYLGGAIASMARIHEPFYFPLIFGVMIWLGLYLRNEKVKSILS